MNTHEEPIHPPTEGKPYPVGDDRGESQRLPQTMDELEFLSIAADFDSERTEQASTPEDAEVLTALGGPQELVDKILAKIAQVPPGEESLSAQVHQSTVVDLASGVNTQVAERPRSPALTQQFKQLLGRLRDCESVEKMSWSCDYHKTRKIGQGGQGTVFLAECLNEHNLPKALKIFSPEPYGDGKAYSDDMRRMGDVVSLIYRIQVDNLVIVERFADHHGVYVMIMRWIDGYDLARLLQPSLVAKLEKLMDTARWQEFDRVVGTISGTSQLRLKPYMAVNIVEKCLQALDALHSQEIVHGDIKPANIMLDQYGSIRLIDIGSAFKLSAPPRHHSWTPRYAPPEILEGGKWTPQSDLASLGYVLIEMLSGQPLVSSSHISCDSTRKAAVDWDRTLLQEKRRLPGRLNELLPADVQKSEDLMNMCHRLIDPDPKKRFESAQAALEGPVGAYPFLRDLTRMNLSVHYASESKRWLADVKRVLN